MKLFRVMLHLMVVILYSKFGGTLNYGTLDG